MQTSPQDVSIIHPKTITQLRKRRQLDTLSQCPTLNRPPPRNPPLPTLQQSTYAVSFPGSGDRMITKYLVESMTGLFVGEASISPSLAEMNDFALNDSNFEQQRQQKQISEYLEEGGKGGIVRGQGAVVAVRTQFPHSTGKLVRNPNSNPFASPSAYIVFISCMVPFNME